MTAQLPEGQRAPGSEWLKNRTRFLEMFYGGTKGLLRLMYPLMHRISPKLTNRTMIWGEKVVKGYMFNCQMCGQCVLHSTGMTCPMNCPKNLRNGPCGGVRLDGHCEVIPELPCVWVQAWERSQKMNHYSNDLQIIQPPVNRALHETSAWINLFEGDDVTTPDGWVLTAPDGNSD